MFHFIDRQTDRKKDKRKKRKKRKKEKRKEEGKTGRIKERMKERNEHKNKQGNKEGEKRVGTSNRDVLFVECRVVITFESNLHQFHFSGLWCYEAHLYEDPFVCPSINYNLPFNGKRTLS